MNYEELVAWEWELNREIADLRLRLDLLPTLSNPNIDDDMRTLITESAERLRQANGELFEVQQALNAEYGQPYVQV